MAVTRSSPGGVVIRYVLPFLWMTSCLLISQGCSTRRRPAEAQRTRSCGLDYKLCAVIPVAGQRTQGTTFRALKVTSQVAVYDCIVSAASHDEYIRCRATCLLFLFFMGITITPTLNSTPTNQLYTSVYNALCLCIRPPPAQNTAFSPPYNKRRGMINSLCDFGRLESNGVYIPFKWTLSQNEKQRDSTLR